MHRIQRSGTGHFLRSVAGSAPVFPQVPYAPWVMNHVAQVCAKHAFTSLLMLGTKYPLVDVGASAEPPGAQVLPALTSIDAMPVARYSTSL